MKLYLSYTDDIAAHGQVAKTAAEEQGWDVLVGPNFGFNQVSVRRRPSCTDVAIVPRSEVGLRQADVRAPKVVAQPLGVRCSICRWG